MARHEIIKAEYLGYCFGVEAAVETAERLLSEAAEAGTPVCCKGSLIHNKHVTDELARRGLITVDGIDEAPPGATLLVRSHGEGKAFFMEAERRGLRVVDATCPRVRAIQKIAEEAKEAGRAFLIIGDGAHPEVQGIAAWYGDDAVVVGSVDEAMSVALPAGRIALACQTTFDEASFADIKDILVKRAGEAGDTSIDIHSTICKATSDRQRAAAKLAETADAMLIIGDRASSNTKKLYDIAKNICKSSYFVENAEDLPLQQLRNYYKIGISAGASTPVKIIEEVITGMSEFLSEDYESNPMFEFMEEVDKALRLPRNGDVITGEVIQVTDKDVIVNIGCKKDGIIPRSEVSLEEGQKLTDVFKEGDEVQAKVLKTDDGDGNILMSKKRVIVSEHWDDIQEALDEKTTLTVNVVREVNGGAIANFEEISGFIPMSQLSDRYVENAQEFIGKDLPVKVMRVDQKRNKVVFSHKAVLADERQKRLVEIWDTLSVGEIVKGKVMRFTEYGAFVDIGGIDGLLHISEISWGKLRHPEEILELDQEIEVKILSMNKEKEKISLSYKQNLPEPWSIINEKYSVGQLITGHAVQLKEYGVFVELEPGLDGLVHISEIAHKRVNNISEEIEVGQEISAQILEIDSDRKRISLSIKATREPSDEDMDEELSAEDEASKLLDAELEMPDADAPVAEGAAEEAAEVFEEKADADLEMPDADAEPAQSAEEAAEVFEEAIEADAELEMPDADAPAAEGAAEEAAEVFEEAVAADAEQEMPDADAPVAEGAAEEAAEVFEEAAAADAELEMPDADAPVAEGTAEEAAEVFEEAIAADAELEMPDADAPVIEGAAEEAAEVFEEAKEE